MHEHASTCTRKIWAAKVQKKSHICKYIWENIKNLLILQEKVQLFPVRGLEGGDGAMGGGLGETLLGAGHVGVTIWVTAYVAAGDDLVPHACSGVTTIGIVKMVAVTAEGVP